MATTLTLEIGSMSRAVAAFADLYDYPEQVPDPKEPGRMIDNPLSQEEFMWGRIASYVREVIVASESRGATEHARLATHASAAAIKVSVR